MTVVSFDSHSYGDLMVEKRYTKYEKARIVGARALQISMGAPIVIEIPKDVIDPLRIALVEFENSAIPMTVKKRSDIT